MFNKVWSFFSTTVLYQSVLLTIIFLIVNNIILCDTKIERVDNISKPIFSDYIRANGKDEVKSYLDNLPIKARHKVIFTINAIEQLGLPNALNTKYVRKIISYKGMYEIKARISHRQERILYFQIIGNHYYLLCGFTKQKPQDQTKAIKHAYKLECEAKRRFHNENI